MKSKNSEWIIFFGEDWHGLNSTAMYLARELSKTHKILWFNSIGLREPRPTLYDIKRVFNKLLQFVNPQTKSSSNQTNSDVPENIHLANPIAIPYYRFKFIRKINHFIISKLIKKQCAIHNIKQPIFISANPATADIMNTASPSLRVYYCADEYSEMPFMPKRVIKKLEEELLTQVDLVLATSKELVKAKQKFHSNAHYLPHGVRYEHMATATLNENSKPKELNSFNKPLIGYVGLIGQHLNLDIIHAAAQSLPDYEFIFIGPVEDGTAPPQLSNITYLGPKPYAEVPLYLAEFKVALLPWNDSPRNQYAHPTKIREYLSAGLQTVCTPHPEVFGIADDHVFVEEDANKYANAIEQAVNSYDAEKRIMLTKSMQIHDWSYRSKTMIDFFNAS